jgi:hypothetical protein
MDVPRKFLIKSDALRKILMDRTLVDVDKLRIIQNGLNSGDFTNDLPSTSESSRITLQDRPKHLSQERPDNIDTSTPLQYPIHTPSNPTITGRDASTTEHSESVNENNDISIDPPEHERISIDEALINKVISSLPKSQRKRGRTVIKLMSGDPQRIWFNKNFELVRKGVTIELTNISDLLRDLLQRREKASPIGWRVFLQGLYSIRLPQNLIGNIDRINYIIGLKSGLDPDSLARIPSIPSTSTVMLDSVKHDQSKSNVSKALPTGSWTVDGSKHDNSKKVYDTEDSVYDSEDSVSNDSDATVDYSFKTQNPRKRRQITDDSVSLQPPVKKRIYEKTRKSMIDDVDADEPMDVSTSNLKRKRHDSLDDDSVLIKNPSKRKKSSKSKKGLWYAYQH